MRTHINRFEDGESEIYNSSNSLFSLHENSYLNLEMNKASYYIENDEIGSSDANVTHIPSNLHTIQQVVSNTSYESISSTENDNHYHIPLTFNYSNFYDEDNQAPHVKQEKYIVILIGLPAVGKSTVSNHLIECVGQNPITQNIRCKIFNAGRVRRQLNKIEIANNSTDDLFSPKNSNKKDIYAKIAFKTLIDEINDNICDLAIFDATNSTTTRRNYLFEEIHKYNLSVNSQFNLCPIVLQVTCENKNFIKYNIHNKTFNDDYFDKPYEVAIVDFTKRLKNYYSQFTPFSKQEFNSAANALFSINNIFYFHLSNVGLTPTDTENQNFNLNSRSNQTSDLLKVINHFINNYAKRFGHIYFENVKNFFNVTKVITTNNFKLLKAMDNLQRLKVLNTTVNEAYFDDLKINDHM